MSGVSFIDPSASDALAALRDEITRKLDCNLYLASCPCKYLKLLWFYAKKSASCTAFMTSWKMAPVVVK